MLSRPMLKVLKMMPVIKMQWPGPDGPTFHGAENGPYYLPEELRFSTYQALLKRRLIKETRTDRTYPETWRVELTPAGRAALEVSSEAE